MNIALVIEHMDVARGGREVATAQLAAALSHAGQAVTILCQSGVAVPGVPLRVLPAPGLTRRARLARFADAVAAVAGEFDIVHTTLPLPAANVYQLHSGTIPGQTDAARRRRGPVVGPLLEALAPLNRKRQFTGRLEAAMMADRRVLMLPVSQLVADEIARHYGRRDNVRVLYNAIEPPPLTDDQRREHRRRLRDKLGLSDDDMLFLTVAKKYALKGVAQTIEAFAAWHRQADRRGRLVVIGRDPVEREGYVRHASVRGVGNACTFLGHESNLAPWYLAADVNVLLTWYDPCSRIVLEAACLGLPSITTAFNGATERLADNAAIVVPSPRDTHAVVAAMHTLTNPAARDAMRKAGLDVIPKLTMRQHVREMMDAYEAVMRQNDHT